MLVASQTKNGEKDSTPEKILVLQKLWNARKNSNVNTTMQHLWSFEPSRGVQQE